MINATAVNPHQSQLSMDKVQQSAPAIQQALSAITNSARSDISALSPQLSQAALPPSLERYLSLPQADETNPPWGLSAAYTATPINAANLLIEQIDIKEDYVVAALPTPPEVGELYEANVANLFVKPWQDAVGAAIERNGGLGTSEQGFLAFSNQYGFIRLRNPRLTPEQNRKLAAISLQIGIPVEKLPSRTIEPGLNKANVSSWVDKFTTQYESKFTEFLQNPEQGMTVKDGRRRYQLKLDPSGIVTSSYYKKSGGFRGFVQNNFAGIVNTVDILSGAKFLKQIPLIGEPIAAAVSVLHPLEYVKLGANWVAQKSVDFKEWLALELTKGQLALSIAPIPGASVLSKINSLLLSYLKRS